jgi:phosphatidylserine/phosphatidylglycerophosphate/cardiolipin synthase-like enzyme
VRKLKLSLVCLGVAAFYGYLIHAATTVILPTPSNPLHFYSNQSQHDLPLVFNRAIKGAAHSIHVTMYAITDAEIIHQLQKKAQNSILVEVFFDLSATFKALPKPIQSFPVKSKGLMHRKIVVVDKSLVFLGSANMTTTSLSLHDNLTCGIYHPGLANFLVKTSVPFYSFTLDKQHATLWLLPDLTQGALHQLLQTIAQAKNSISIAMFTLTHPLLIEALIKAHKRGIEVKLAVDHFTAKGASNKAIKQLKEAGVSVVLSLGMQLLHHKWAYIDQKTFIFGSTNWTAAAFKKNQDILLFLENLTSDQIRYLDRLWHIIELESN